MAELPSVPGSNPEIVRPVTPDGPVGPGGGSLGEQAQRGVPDISGIGGGRRVGDRPPTDILGTEPVTFSGPIGFEPAAAKHEPGSQTASPAEPTGDRPQDTELYRTSEVSETGRPFEPHERRTEARRLLSESIKGDASPDEILATTRAIQAVDDVGRVGNDLDARDRVFGGPDSYISRAERGRLLDILSDVVDAEEGTTLSLDHYRGEDGRHARSTENAIDTLVGLGLLEPDIAERGSFRVDKTNLPQLAERMAAEASGEVPPSGGEPADAPRKSGEPVDAPAVGAEVAPPDEVEGVPDKVTADKIRLLEILSNPEIRDTEQMAAAYGTSPQELQQAREALEQELVDDVFKEAAGHKHVAVEDLSVDDRYAILGAALRGHEAAHIAPIYSEKEGYRAATLYSRGPSADQKLAAQYRHPLYTGLRKEMQRVGDEVWRRDNASSASDVKK